MGNLKEIRTRIASVRSTRKITSAMRIVAAAKYHKANEEYDRFKGFAARYRALLGLTLSECEHRGLELAHPLLHSANESAPTLVLMLSSNTSLCGAFNANVAHFTAKSLVGDSQGAQASGVLGGAREVSPVWAFGRKGAEILTKQGGILPVQEQDHLVERPSFDAMGSMFDGLLNAFVGGEYSKVEVVYNQYVNAAVQRPIRQQLFPLMAPEHMETASGLEYIIEPSVEVLLERLLPYSAKLRLFDIFLQNYVGEHGARMTSMAQATDNADALIDELTLDYNKARQGAITNELVEIVSGADALK